MRTFVSVLVGLFGIAWVVFGDDQSTVFVSGQDGYACYRIPAIVKAGSGNLIAFAEGRVNGCSDTGDIDLVMKRSVDLGKSWGPLSVVASDAVNTCGNPVPIVERRSGVIVLVFTKNPGDAHESAILKGEAPPRSVWVTKSVDDGVTWSTPREISEQVRRPEFRWYATGPGHGIQLEDGTLIAPANHSNSPEHVDWHSHVIRSVDGGETWSLGGIAEGKTNESTVAELADGRLYLNMRSYHGEHRRYSAVSMDQGVTWGPIRQEAELVEPVCQGSVLAVSERTVLLFSNPASEKRESMTIHISRDQGARWRKMRPQWAGPSAYSDLVEIEPKLVGCLYECGDAGPYERIVLDRVVLDKR